MHSPVAKKSMLDYINFNWLVLINNLLINNSLCDNNCKLNGRGVSTRATIYALLANLSKLKTLQMYDAYTIS